MKIQGRELNGPLVETIVIPRGDDAPIIFKAKAVLDFDEFDKMVPEPKAPWVRTPSGKRQDFSSKTYLDAMRQRIKQQTNYMFIKSLEATEGLVWETIDLTKPETWLNFENELKEAGFSNSERNRIVDGCMAANCLSEKRVEEARQRFIQSQADIAQPESSLLEEQ